MAAAEAKALKAAAGRFDRAASRGAARRSLGLLQLQLFVLLPSIPVSLAVCPLSSVVLLTSPISSLFFLLQLICLFAPIGFLQFYLFFFSSFFHPKPVLPLFLRFSSIFLIFSPLYYVSSIFSIPFFTSTSFPCN